MYLELKWTWTHYYFLKSLQMYTYMTTNLQMTNMRTWTWSSSRMTNVKVQSDGILWWRLSQLCSTQVQKPFENKLGYSLIFSITLGSDTNFCNTPLRRNIGVSQVDWFHNLRIQSTSTTPLINQIKVTLFKQEINY